MISIPCMLICGIFTRETVFVKRQQRRGNTTLALVRSFKYTFKDKNARFLILAEFLFPYRDIWTIGDYVILFYLCIKKIGAYSGFSVALSLGMLLANALAAFLMVRMDKNGLVYSLPYVRQCVAYCFSLLERRIL